MDAGTIGNVASRRTLEAAFGERLDCRIQQLMLGDDAALLLFSGGFWLSRRFIVGQAPGPGLLLTGLGYRLNCIWSRPTSF